MAQDDDVTDLKQRLGLDESEESGEQEEAEGDAGGAEPAAQGGPPGGGGPPQSGGPPQGGGPPGGQQGGPGSEPTSQPGVHEAKTRNAPPPGQRGGQPGGQQPGGQQPGGPGGGAGAPGGPEPGGSEFGDTAPSDSPAGEEFGGGDDFDAGGPEPEGPAFADVDEDLDPGDGLLNQGVLTNKVLVLLAVCLGVGLLFGIFGTSSYQSRSLYNARTSQAQQVLKELQPKIENYGKVRKKVQGLDLTGDTYDLETAKELANLPVAFDMTAVGANNLLLGSEITSMLQAYMVQSERLQQMLKSHHKKTKNDKKELERLTKKSEGDKEKKEGEKEGSGEDGSETYVIWFPFKKYKQAVGQEDYKPDYFSGRLVKAKSLEPGEDGNIEVVVPDSGASKKVNPRGLVPITRDQLLSGDDALQRYKRRVGQIKQLVKQMKAQPKQLEKKVQAIANRGSAPLLQL